MPGEDDKTQPGTGAAAAADDKPAVVFKTREEFHREVDRKANAAAKKAAEDTQAKIFEMLGLESEDDLPKLKDTIASSTKTVSEAEKLKTAHDKLTKEHGKEKARGDALQSKLKGIAKRDALAPFASRVRDMEALTMFADRALEVDDEGAVTVKDGGKIDDWVENLLKAKDYLKVAPAAAGAGTTATEPRKPNDSAATVATASATAGAATTTAGAANGQANGAAKPKSFGAVIVEAIKARNTFPNSGP